HPLRHGGAFVRPAYRQAWRASEGTTPFARAPACPASANGSQSENAWISGSAGSKLPDCPFSTVRGPPMYVPPHFAESDPAKLFDFIERHSFGLLVSHVGGVPFASHLPFLLDCTTGPHGTLLGHVARANPHWRELSGQTALAV